MRYVKVNVRRDESADIPVHVGAWEVPVLEAKQGEDRVTVGETVDFENRPWPESAKAEWQRLSGLYGRTGSGDDALTFVERVYGTGSRGLEALEAAIEKARAEGKPAKKQTASDKAAALTA